jgi:hypothetical protein
MLTLIGILIYQRLDHNLEMGKLQRRLDIALSCECPKVKTCPICLPKVIEIPCNVECAPLECGECPTWFELCQTIDE